MDQIELKIASREVLGKKVRFLRRQGITPVHLFGQGIESAALQCDTDKLRRVLSEAGKARLISLKIDNEKTPRNAVIREVQIEPRSGELLHVDFYQVQMAEAIRVGVPIVLVGEAPALKSKENMLVHTLTTLTIECLPGKIPANIEIDITSLTEKDQAVRVKDIELDSEITVLNDPELLLVKISVRRIEKVEEAVAAVEEVVEGAEAAPGAEAKGEPPSSS